MQVLHFLAGSSLALVCYFESDHFYGLMCLLTISTNNKQSYFHEYRISANSFRGNYSFLNLTLSTVTFGHSTYRCGNYSREETIQGRKLFAEIRYIENCCGNYLREETIRGNTVVTILAF